MQQRQSHGQYDLCRGGKGQQGIIRHSGRLDICHNDKGRRRRGILGRAGKDRADSAYQCLYPYRQRHQVPGAVPAGLGRYRCTDAVPRSYCGRADLDLPGACPAAVCARLPGTVSGRQRRRPGHDAGLFRHCGGTPRLITLIPRHRQTVAALIFRVAGVPLHPHKFHLMIL